MRCVITANDAQDRSYVAQEIEIEGAVTTAFALDDLTSLLPVKDVLDMGDILPPPGGVRWLFSRLKPGEVMDMHATATIDFDVVIEGEMDLILDSGVVTLAAGDGALVTGRHAGKSGPNGCYMALVILGIGANANEA